MSVFLLNYLNKLSIYFVNDIRNVIGTESNLYAKFKLVMLAGFCG